MKKVFLILIIIINTLVLFACTKGYKYEDSENKELVYKDLADKIIRFHVIANSDTEEDQKLKLEVRDAVVGYVYDRLKDSKSLEESRSIIIENKELIENIAEEVIKEKGYDYTVTSSLSMENFPDKVYGDVIFPQGEYEAYRILIGEAKGQNWWCVMFPPLCFLDETKETIDTDNVKETIEEYEDEKNLEDKDNSGEELKEEKTEEEIKEEEIIDNERIDDEKKSEGRENKIEFKFKIFDIIKNIFNDDKEK